MPTITYLPDNKSVEAEAGETILQTSLRLGIPHTHVCGGNARCSTCRVIILDGLENCSQRNSREQALANRLRFSPQIRLACQTLITGDVTLRRLVLDAEDVELTSQLTPDRTPIAAGKEQKIAILFADIRKFTAFSESLPPYDVIHVLNRYFDQMGKVINRNGGYIDNYMGDGLMALFGVDQPQQATLRAVRAGLGMLEAVEQLRAYLENIYAMSFQIGVGVHYGEVVLGSIGAKDARRMTAIGDAVNLASRIEQANKEYGTQLLVSEHAYAEVRQHARVGREFADAALKGKSGRYRLYEIVGLDS
ncbi:MAG: adenylate/guanylate cyclase domain-containing protein [Betaproteobacteria bacterium]|nr:adenylate/guanylate cyclase domain-containing protein [Betaproteobacteria bacterium]